MTIDRSARGWPYQQLAGHLRDGITSGRLGPKLPSIADVADTYSVSRMTAQRAYEVLKDEGLVVSEPGRGYFTADGK